MFFVGPSTWRQLFGFFSSLLLFSSKLDFLLLFAPRYQIMSMTVTFIYIYLLDLYLQITRSFYSRWLRF